MTVQLAQALQQVRACRHALGVLTLLLLAKSPNSQPAFTLFAAARCTIAYLCAGHCADCGSERVRSHPGIPERR